MHDDGETADRWIAKVLGVRVSPPEPKPPHPFDDEPPLPHNIIRVNRRADMDSEGISLYTLEVTNIKTEAGQRILMEVLPRVLELFLVKNQDYGDEMNTWKLGPKGQFVDIWRKVGKLKAALWDGKEMVGEQADEMLMDLVGHILLALSDMWRG